MYIRSLTFFLGLLACLVTPTTSHALPVSSGFFPAAGIAGETSFPIVQYLHLDFRENPNGLLAGLMPRAETDILFFAGGKYLTSNIVVFASVPWLHTVFKITTPNLQTIETKTAGWGDAGLTAFVRLWQAAGKGWYSSAGLFPAVRFPTGSWDQKNASGRIDRTLQPGTGNYSGILSGVVWFIDTTKQATLNIQYQHFFKGHDFQFGDQWTYNASIGYLLLPWKLPEKAPTWYLLNVNVEFLGLYIAKPDGQTAVNFSQNWGRLVGSVSAEFAKIFSKVEIAFHQTVYYITQGGIAPVRPQRVYQATWSSNF